MFRTHLQYASLLVLLTSAHPARADVLSVSLNGGGWHRDDGVGYRAMLQVDVGWEQLLFGRRSKATLSQPAEEGGPPEPPENDETTAEEQNPSISPEVKEPLGASPAPLPPWLRSDFARALLRVVLRVPNRRRGALESLSTRSRTSTLLPVLRLRAGRGSDETLRYSPTLDDPDRWLQSGGAEFRYEAQATWTLDRLVFADDEIAIERLRQQTAKAERDRGVRALEVFFEWQTAEVRLERTDLDEDARIKLQIVKIQSEIELDVLSGGWFSKELERLQATLSAP